MRGVPCNVGLRQHDGFSRKTRRHAVS
jgi:hypothetical protein